MYGTAAPSGQGAGACSRKAARGRKYRRLPAAADVPGGRPRAEPRPIVVGWGNASTGYGSVVSRQGRGPNKAFIRLLLQRGYVVEVHMIDEWRTSKVNACMPGIPLGIPLAHMT